MCRISTASWRLNTTFLRTLLLVKAVLIVILLFNGDIKPGGPLIPFDKNKLMPALVSYSTLPDLAFVTRTFITHTLDNNTTFDHTHSWHFPAYRYTSSRNVTHYTVTKLKTDHIVASICSKAKYKLPRCEKVRIISPMHTYMLAQTYIFTVSSIQILYILDIFDKKTLFVPRITQQWIHIETNQYLIHIESWIKNKNKSNQIQRLTVFLTSNSLRFIEN